MIEAHRELGVNDMPRNDKDAAVLDRPITDGSTVTGGAPEANVNGTGAEGAGVGDSGSGEAPASGEATAAKRTKRDPDTLGDDEMVGVNVRIPNKLRKLVSATATEQNTSVPQLLANMLAEAYEFELPKPKKAAAKKYASKEERLAAQKEQQAKQRTTTKALLAAIEEGKIEVDVEALLRDYMAKQAAENAAKEGANTETASNDTTTTAPVGAAAS